MSKGELAIDPRGLIYEAYRMEVGAEDCRTIFLDWALGLPEAPGRPEIAALLAHYGARQPDHPMTSVLREGLDRHAATPARRGGRRGRSPIDAAPQPADPRRSADAGEAREGLQQPE